MMPTVQTLNHDFVNMYSHYGNHIVYRTVGE